MSSTNDNISAKLIYGLNALNLKLDSNKIEKLLILIKELERWNKKINLTAIRSIEDMVSGHLLDSLIGLIVVYIVLLMPIAVWIMVDFFNKVPREIDETALIDGCNPYQAFFKVVLPNSVPGLIVAGMFCIIFGWIDFFFAFILTFTEVQLLPVKIVALNSSITPWWSLSASALVSVAPLIIVAFIVERYLSKGNLSGAIK